MEYLKYFCALGRLLSSLSVHYDTTIIIKCKKHCIFIKYTLLVWRKKDWQTKYILSTGSSGLTYSEVPNRRACSLRFFTFSFHPVRNFSCNKRKIPPCSFINLLIKKAGRVNFFPNLLVYSGLLFY